jgi:hypothetical protein
MVLLKGDGYQSGEFADVIRLTKEDMIRFPEKRKRNLKGARVLSVAFSHDI